VLASGAWSPRHRRAGRRGACRTSRTATRSCASEPLKPSSDPLVSVLDSGLYFSQSMRGEKSFGGMGDPHEAPALNLSSTARFMARYSAALLEQMPRLGRVKLIRQWSGPYDVID